MSMAHEKSYLCTHIPAVASPLFDDKDVLSSIRTRVQLLHTMLHWLYRESRNSGLLSPGLGAGAAAAILGNLTTRVLT